MYCKNDIYQVQSSDKNIQKTFFKYINDSKDNNFIPELMSYNPVSADNG